jgi:type IV pilus assembly protein PilM
MVLGIKSGGQAVTQAFSQSLRVSTTEAESMKRDLAPSTQPSSLPPALLEAVKSIVHELRYTKQLYADQRGRPVQKVLLSGGGALLPGLAAYLSHELNVNTYVADPWARVAAPPEARGLLEEVGARLAVAIGLGLRVTDQV